MKRDEIIAFQALFNFRYIGRKKRKKKEKRNEKYHIRNAGSTSRFNRNDYARTAACINECAYVKVYRENAYSSCDSLASSSVNNITANHSVDDESVIHRGVKKSEIRCSHFFLEFHSRIYY